MNENYYLGIDQVKVFLSLLFFVVTAFGGLMLIAYVVGKMIDIIMHAVGNTRRDRD